MAMAKKTVHRLKPRITNHPKPKRKKATEPAPEGIRAGAAAVTDVKVRMYRQGLGDCFLLTFPRPGGERPFYMLIDCGVVLGTPDAGAIMMEVVEDIRATTENIDLLVVTHEHWDHNSGFVQAKSVFAKLNVHNVWLA
jgi:glyoxylase-like metal-dependent hydrolase (beta-lactamase superfamily II)